MACSCSLYAAISLPTSPLPSGFRMCVPGASEWCKQQCCAGAAGRSRGRDTQRQERQRDEVHNRLGSCAIPQHRACAIPQHLVQRVPPATGTCSAATNTQALLSGTSTAPTNIDCSYKHRGHSFLLQCFVAICRCAQGRMVAEDAIQGVMRCGGMGRSSQCSEALSA